jgi:NTE family protein
MAQNIKDIESVGTKVKWIVAGAPEGINLTDPRQIQPALKAGYERAKKEAAQIKAFWA